MKRILLHTLALLALFQSCIKEDLSKCHVSELLLRFEYTLNDSYTNLFGQEVSGLTVYIFDENGKYVDKFTADGNELTNDYVMHIPLLEGKYSAVVYGGDFKTYSVGELNDLNVLNQNLRNGITDINDFRMELNNIGGAENYLYPVNTPNDLYVGQAANLIAVTDNQNITTVNLMKITKKIKVKIYGTDLVGAPLDIYITALNGRYKYNNGIDPNHGIFKYTPVNTLLKPNYMEVDLKMMRLMLDQSPMLIVKNSLTGEILYNENMISQILLTQAYVRQEDFDREDEFVFEIPIQSNGNGLSVTVSINGWNISDIDPDM